LARVLLGVRSPGGHTALRDSGDAEEVGRLLDYSEDAKDWDRCCEIADEAGAYGFVALDLALAFHNPRAFAKLIPMEQGAEPPRPPGRPGASAGENGDFAAGEGI
jgi:hypothetical protein